MKILVTGAAGFIGSHLAERLAGHGHEVVGLDCLTDYYDPALKRRNLQALSAAGVSVAPLDLAADDLTSVLADVEVVYHLAAQPGLAPRATFDSYLRNNLVATQRLLEGLRATRWPQAFINISTSSVYGSDATGSEESEPRPTSYYGVTKLAAEQLALALQRDQGFPACSFRIFSVYGPRERPDKLFPQLIRGALTDQPVPIFAGSEQHMRSFTFIADIIDGLLAPLERFERCSGEIFNLGKDASETTGAALRIVEELVSRPLRITRLPRRAGDQNRTEANIAKARRILGYSPSTSLREGLARSIAWYRENLDQAPL